MTSSEYVKTPPDPEKEGKDEIEFTNFDDVLRTMGHNNRLQKQLVFILTLLAFSVGYQNFTPVFTLTIPNHRCAIPGLPNDTYHPNSEAHENLVNLSIPRKSDGKFDQCTILEEVVQESSNVTLEQRSCSKWVFDHSVFESTLVEQLNLVCEGKIMRSHANMMVFAGKFVGAIVQGVACDIFGRQKLFWIMSIGLAVCTFGNAFVTSTVALMVLRFFTGMTTTASYVGAFVLLMEFTLPSHRSMMTFYIKMGFTIGQLGLGGAAYLIRDWKTLQLFTTWPAVLQLFCLWMVPESPRWLIAKGHKQKLERALKHAAKVSKVILPDDVSSQLTEETKSHAPAIQLFTDVTLVVRWAVIYVNWVVIVMVYYGLTLNVSNLSGNIFVNFLASVGTEIFALSVASRIVLMISRKRFHIYCMLLSGIACTATFLPILLDGDRWIVVTLSMVGKLGVSCAFFVIYTYTAEVFPTTHRGFGVGSSSMIARLGGMVAPYVADLNTYVGGDFGQVLPQLVFGGAGILGGILTFLLPDTRGRKLPETIDDARNYTAQVTVSQTDSKKPKKTVNGIV